MSKEEAVKKLEAIASQILLYKMVDNINKDLLLKMLERAIKELNTLLKSVNDSEHEVNIQSLLNNLLEQNFPFCAIILDLIIDIDFNELDPKEIFKGA